MSGPASHQPGGTGPSSHGPSTYGPSTYGPSTYGPSTYGPSTYGDAFADVYDDWYHDVSDAAATVRAVTDLARAVAAGRDAAAGPAVGAGVSRPSVLELGVGTGRLAVPLAAAGLDVTGVDASAAMLAVLARNDSCGRVRAVLGDMAGPLPGGPFDVVLAAFNTFLNLATESDQASCLRHVVGVLGPAGVLALEAFVPHLGVGPAGNVEPRRVGTSVVLDVSIRDRHRQTVRGQQIELGPGAGQVRLRPWRIRYLGVDELDAMAARAGLWLVDRFEDWNGSPFVVGSVRHISLYRVQDER